MKINVEVVHPSLPPPPPSEVHIYLVLSSEEAHLLRTYLGRNSRTKVEQHFNDTLYSCYESVNHEDVYHILHTLYLAFAEKDGVY